MLLHHPPDLLGHALPAQPDPVLRPSPIAGGSVGQHALALSELCDCLLQVRQVLGRAHVAVHQHRQVRRAACCAGPAARGGGARHRAAKGLGHGGEQEEQERGEAESLSDSCPAALQHCL